MNIFWVVLLIMIVAFKITILLIYTTIYMMTLCTTLHILHESNSHMIIRIVMDENIIIGSIFSINFKYAFLFSYEGTVVIFWITYRATIKMDGATFLISFGVVAIARLFMFLDYILKSI